MAICRNDGQEKTALRWAARSRFSVEKGEATLRFRNLTLPNYALTNFRRSVPASPIKPVPISIRLPGSGTAL